MKKDINQMKRKTCKEISTRGFRFSCRTEFITEEKIIEALHKHGKCRYAYILHDKDVYSQADEDEETKQLGREYEKITGIVKFSMDDYVDDHLADRVQYLEKAYDDQRNTCSHTKEEFIAINTADLRLSYRKEYNHAMDTSKLSKEEYVKNNRTKVCGTLKPAHYHIVIYYANSVTIKAVAERFGLAENIVQTINAQKGERYSFILCVEYLTHEREQGKYRYSDSEVHANFDFRAEINKFRQRLERGIICKTLKDDMRISVGYEGKTLSECRNENPLAYVNDMTQLGKLRNDYISNAEPPELRINIYISGESGSGKSLLSQAMARRLFPDIQEDNDVFFSVGAEKTLFEGYEGQPVLIWDDRRANEMVSSLGGVGNVLTIFDPHPIKKRQNVKYSSVNLINTFNIINSVDSPVKFLNALVGYYSDPDLRHDSEAMQSYRRFQIIIKVRKDTFNVYVNEGFWNNTSDFDKYKKVATIQCNMQEIAVKKKNNTELRNKVEAKALGHVIKLCNELRDRAKKMDITEEQAAEILKDFEEYGKVL